MTYRLSSPCLAAPAFGAGPAPRAAAPDRRLRRAVWALVETVACWRERAVQRRALARLDDRLLSDIGVSRGEALAEADKPFWRA